MNIKETPETGFLERIKRGAGSFFEIHPDILSGEWCGNSRELDILRGIIFRRVAAVLIFPLSAILLYHFTDFFSDNTMVFSLVCLIDLWLAGVIFIRKHFFPLAMTGVVLLYLMGGVSLFQKGSAYIGPLLLFALPIITGFILGLRWVVLSLVTNLLILVMFFNMKPELAGRLPMNWSEYLFYFVFLDGVFAFSMTYIMNTMESALGRERSVSAALELGSRELIRANEHLEKEMEDRTRAEDALRQSEEKFRTMIEQSSEVILIITLEGVVTYASRSVERVFGTTAQEIIGTDALRFVHPDDREGLRLILVNAARYDREVFSSRYRNKHARGGWIVVETTFSNLVSNPLIGGFLLNIRDISQQVEAQQKVRYLEDHDHLTRLPNRDMFIRRLQQEIHRAERKKYLFAVLCANIDRFKEINEIYGPAAGDRVLRHMAERLKGIFRGEDVVARLAGDEFGILLCDISSYDDAIDILERTSHVFSTPVTDGDVSIRVTASIGVCLYPNDGETEDILLLNCESALHMAKASGRNNCRFFDRALHDQLLRRILIEKELENAIANDQFTVYYQPKVYPDGRIYGMEALARWDSPVLGSVSPVEFIPVAESSGHILEMGYMILEKACVQHREWREKGMGDMVISVNLSPFQFSSRTLLEDISRIIQTTGMRPELLELEITESGIMEDEEDAVEKLNAIHRMGLKISIDDFGIGYSSLSKLKTYPVDTLKIDRSFVEDIPSNAMSVKIVNSIMNLASNLGFSVIAEGVEKEEQVSFFRNQGCSRFQGFYFYPPIPAEEMETLLVCRKNAADAITPV